MHIFSIFLDEISSVYKCFRWHVYASNVRTMYVFLHVVCIFLYVLKLFGCIQFANTWILLHMECKLY